MSTAAPRAEPRPPDGAGLLDRAVAYARSALQLVPGTPPAVPTPCRDWTLGDLLLHMDDSLATFTEAAETGHVALRPVPVHPDPAVAVVLRLKARACHLLAAWSQQPGPGVVTVGDRPLRPDLLAAAGALEIAVHGWDVAQACGRDLPLPAALAVELLDVLPLLVHDADRPGRFAERSVVPVHARPSVRLLAAVGRVA